MRSHKDNEKNIAVDRICNASANPPEREDYSHLAGKKTASKLREWMKNLASGERLKAVVEDNKDSATKDFIRKHLANDNGPMQQRPENYNLLPRKQGVLLAKARTNRWTRCQAFQKSIEQSQTSICIHCKQEYTTEHVINECTLHEALRETMRLRLQHTGRVTQLLTSRKDREVRELAAFLAARDDERKGIDEDNPFY